MEFNKIMTIYDVFFFAFALIYLPYLVIKGKAHKDFLQRFGFLPPTFFEIGKSRPVWIHAVSVGEVLAVKNFVKEFRAKYPEKRIALSTTTRTGSEIAGKVLGREVSLFYFPVDFSFVIRRVIGILKPSILIIIETELWPNLIREVSKKNIPIAVLNGRISERSFKGYYRIKFFFKGILERIDLFCMRTQTEAERIKTLGGKSENVRVTGNMKFDIETASAARVDISNVFIAGSTHGGEEEIVLKVYAELIKEFGDLRLLIAPRHVDRARAIKGFTEERGFRAIMWSESRKDFSEHISGKTVFILDTFGELAALYSVATVVFMGGSLVRRGGHNLVEPASSGRPIVFGPYMFNFKDMARIFLEHNAAVEVKDGKRLLDVLRVLLRDKDERDRLGTNALRLIDRNKGATERNIYEVGKLFSRAT